ncbi:MAG: dihydropteroate synthase, partial [Planctomycetota bacterium]
TQAVDTPPALRFPKSPPLTLDRPRLMGVLNVTPDSFSDGGRFAGVADAVEHARRLVREGASVLDVGGESTRPGAARVPVEEQIARVVPVVAAVRAMLDAEALPGVISVDTTRAAVAEAALDAGAELLNDVSGGLESEQERRGGMAALAAARNVPLVLMHMRGKPADMQADPRYLDVVAEVAAFLDERAAAAEASGVPSGQVVVDPGIGFGKTLEHNLALLAGLGDLVGRQAQAGRHVLLGASRKSMFAKLDPTMAEPGDRLPGTLATTAWAVGAGCRLIRVHDVLENAQVCRVVLAICREQIEK